VKNLIGKKRLKELIALLCFRFPIHIPSVLFLFANDPEKKNSISFKAIDMSFLELCHLLIAKFVCYVLGSLANRNKTEGMWIGNLKHSKDKVENIS
jgi:hypothetical protein